MSYFYACNRCRGQGSMGGQLCPWCAGKGNVFGNLPHYAPKRPFSRSVAFTDGRQPKVLIYDCDGICFREILADTELQATANASEFVQKSNHAQETTQ